MLTLITAALVASQPPPATANSHAQHAQMPQGQMAPMQHEQHEGMKKDCCKECCKGMGKHDEHAPAAQPQRGQ